MGLQSALTTSLTGLQAAETVIDVVGNNVANSGTVGFKESNVLFATQFLQTQSIGSAPTDNTGGTNPRQIGLGVKVAAINPNFTQGTIEISSNPLDVAIQGDGFLIVEGSQGEELYTRNGQLQTNSQNEIVTVTGNRVLGFGVDENFEIDSTTGLVPLNIPLGNLPVAQATQEAFFAGVLSPGVDIGSISGEITSQALGDINVEIPDVARQLQFRRLPNRVRPEHQPQSRGRQQRRRISRQRNLRVSHHLVHRRRRHPQRKRPQCRRRRYAQRRQRYRRPVCTSDRHFRLRRLGRPSHLSLGQRRRLPTPRQYRSHHSHLHRHRRGGRWPPRSTRMSSIKRNIATTSHSTTAAARSRAGPPRSLVRFRSPTAPAAFASTTSPSRPVAASIRSASTATPVQRPTEFRLVDAITAGTFTSYIDAKSDDEISVLNPTNPTLDLLGAKANATTPLVDVVILNGDEYVQPFVERRALVCRH